jgi:hypothetical protein
MFLILAAKKLQWVTFLGRFLELSFDRLRMILEIPKSGDSENF